MISAKDFLAHKEAQFAQRAAENQTKAQEFIDGRKGTALNRNTDLGYVYDGDTVYDDKGGQRLLGGDTHEMRNADGSAQPMSIEAQERLQQLLESGEYTKQFSGAKGKRGRDLTNYINADGESAMTQLIREGYASPTSYGGNNQAVRAEGAAINAQFEASNTLAETGTTPALDAMRDLQPRWS